MNARRTLQLLLCLGLIGNASAQINGQASSSSVTQQASSTNVSRAPSQRGRASSSVARARDRAHSLAVFGNANLQSPGSSVFVVPDAETPLADLVTAHEDMTVMAKLFERALESATRRGRDQDILGSLFELSRSDHGVTRAGHLYLKGYGALFALAVNAPLSPGIEEQHTAPDEGQEDIDAVWQEARNDIFAPERVRRAEPSRGEHTPEYSPETVERLKAALIGAMKHAANIRALAAGEVVVVTVLGATVPGNTESLSSVAGTDEFEFIDNEGLARATADALNEKVHPTAPTVLMIRAKASDISAVAKGQLNQQQFREKLEVVTYPHLAGMMAPRGILALPTSGVRR